MASKYDHHNMRYR